MGWGLYPQEMRLKPETVDKESIVAPRIRRESYCIFRIHQGDKVTDHAEGEAGSGAQFSHMSKQSLVALRRHYKSKLSISGLYQGDRKLRAL